MANDWHQCVNWLVQCQMLSKEHRLCSDTARVQDLANFLKDGVLICNLLNHLVPETLDPRDFSQRPQMSQVVSIAIYVFNYLIYLFTTHSLKLFV